MAYAKQDWSLYPVTVFHLDDQRSVTKSVKKMLKHVPHTHFHECNDPTQAMTQILNIGPTVILLDLHMPIINGFEILQQLQQHEATQDIPVLILTMDNDIESHRKAFALGANDYLIKIPDKAELVLRLRYHTRAYVDHLEHLAHYKALIETKKKLKQLVAKLEQSSYQDCLTEIPNRRSFDRYFDVEWQRALRETTPLSLILIDIDYFKQYNDFYGHLVGDDCLKQVAQALQNTLLRPTDMVARYGGEEFVVLLPNTHGQGATQVAERLRKAVVALQLEHNASECCDTVTVSLGAVTTVPMMKHHPREFIHTADEALYEAKRQGRNRVICKSL